MKKMIAAFILLLIAGSVYSLDVKAGLALGMSPMNSTRSYTNVFILGDYSTAQDYNQMSVGAFFDMTYLRVDLGYAFSAGEFVTSTYDEAGNKTDSDYEADFSASYLNIALIGKYPFKLVNWLSVWPALGLEYSVNLYYGTKTENNNTDAFYAGLSDFYLKGGIGADIMMARNVYLVPVFMFSWNLTPPSFKTDSASMEDMTFNAYDNYEDYAHGFAIHSWTGYKLDFSLGLAYKF